MTFESLLLFIRLTFPEDPWGVAVRPGCEQVTVQIRVDCMEEVAGSELG